MIDLNLVYNTGAIVVGALAGHFIPKIKVNKITESKINTGFATADSVIDEIKKVLPNNKVVNIVDFIEKRAEKAVNSSEQAYHNGDVKTDEERFKVANDYVLNALSIAGVTPTSTMRSYIEDAIQSYVNALGHKPQSESEKQAQLNKLQQDLASSQAEAEQLKQKLVTIQSTAGVNTVNTGNTTTQPA